MKVLVTGANGLLGQKLTTVLDKDPSIQLVATARRPLSVLLTGSTYLPLDVTDQKAINHVIATYKPDVIIHTAAMTQVDQCETDRDACWKNNVNAVEYLAQAAAENNSHLIHLSTDFIFDGTSGPLDESAEPHPLSYYGHSKLAAEQAIEKSKVRAAILRTVLVYGVTADMSRSNIVLWVKKSLEDKKPINVVTDQWRTPTLAEDLAMGCILAARKKATGVFHVSGAEMMTPYEIAIKTAEFFKLDTGLITATDSSRFTQPATRPLRTGFIIEKARKELGFQPHTFSEGLTIVGDQIKR